MGNLHLSARLMNCSDDGRAEHAERFMRIAFEVRKSICHELPDVRVVRHNRQMRRAGIGNHANCANRTLKGGFARFQTGISFYVICAFCTIYMTNALVWFLKRDRINTFSFLKCDTPICVHS